MAAEAKVKILVCGDVESGLDALFAKVEKANKAGPFAALFCVGNFFASAAALALAHASATGAGGAAGAVASAAASAAAEAAANAALAPYKHGTKKVPLPTYVVAGADGVGGDSILAAVPNGGEIAPGIRYLGRSGVAEVAGLAVAFLSGVYDADGYHDKPTPARALRFASPYVEADVDALVKACAARPRGVDMLLTAEWPRQYHHLLSDAQLPPNMPNARSIGSPVLGTAVAAKVVTRYHFAGTQNTYFALPPFKNSLHCTRFIGLASLANAAQKSLFAGALAPVAKIDAATLALWHAEGVTDIPYLAPVRLPAAAAAAASAAAVDVKVKAEPTNAPALYHPMMKKEAGAGADGDAPAFKRQKLSQLEEARFGGNYMGFDPNEKEATPAFQAQRFEMRAPPRSYVCRKCNQPGHFIKDCPLVVAENKAREQRRAMGGPPPGTAGAPPEGYVCKKCNQPGHYITDCPLYTPAGANGARSDVPPAGYVCKKCNQPGHFLRLCPLILAETGGVPAGGPRAVPADYICKKCNQPGHWIRDCPNTINMPRGQKRPLEDRSAEECWFCLKNPNVAAHLIISIGDEFYIALPKGGLVAEHSLLMPIEHIGSGTELSDGALAELKRFMEALKVCFATKGLSVVFYERFIPTRGKQHMNVQVVPIPTHLADAVEDAFRHDGKLMGLDFVELPAGRALRDEMGPNPYIHVTLPSGKQILHKVNPEPKARPRGMFDLPRGVLANLIGQPARVDWKLCALNAEQEKTLVDTFKDLFKPFDFTLPLDAEPDPSAPAPATAPAIAAPDSAAAAGAGAGAAAAAAAATSSSDAAAAAAVSHGAAAAADAAAEMMKTEAADSADIKPVVKPES